MYKDKTNIIQNLTGINSSKKNYYIELRKKSSQIAKQNTQLEIINKLAKSINVNMSITEMMASVAEQLNQIFSFQEIELYLLERGQLVLKVEFAEQPMDSCCTDEDADKKEKRLWQSMEEQKSFLLQPHHADQAQLMIVPLTTNGKVIGALTISSCQNRGMEQSDLTFGQQLADQLAVCIENARLYEELKEMLEVEAQVRHSAKLAAVGQMSAGVAHELNNPLTAILGNAQLLMRKFDKDQKEHLLAADIVQGSIRCKKIIEGLLTFSRQEQQPFEQMHINAAIERVLNLVSHQIKCDKTKLELQYHPDDPIITGNSQQLEQVLVNLILNAKDAVATCEEPRINIRAVTEDHPRYSTAIKLVVEDNGQGIHESELSNIFTPFYTTKPVGYGTGLGLWVSLGIVEAHGGTIQVTSREGQGSSFNVIIPLKGE